MKKKNIVFTIGLIALSNQLSIATPSLTSMFEPGIMTTPLIKYFQEDTEVIGGSDNVSAGRYNKSSKTAWLYNPNTKKITQYQDIIVQSSAGTAPPKSMNPKVEEFATMPNPNYTPPTSMIVGGPLKTLSLWGVVVPTTQSVMPGHKPSPRKVMPVQPNIPITGVNGDHGIYNPDNKTALIYSKPLMEYTDIVEYKQAVTPPNIGNEALVRFATMPNPHFTGEMMPGGQFKDIVLYGIPKNPVTATQPHHSQNTAEYMKQREQYMGHIAQKFIEKGLPAPPVAP